LTFFAGRWLAATQAPAVIASGAGGLRANGALAADLERQLASYQPTDALVKIGVSFHAADGDYCRTFVLRETQGLACRDAGGWKVQIASLASPLASSNSYRTAGEEMPTPVLEAMDRMIQGAPLDRAGEVRARARAGRGPDNATYRDDEWTARPTVAGTFSVDRAGV
jgi:hypothetical protein